MNLNKFTKAELISKIKDQNLLNHKLIDKVQNLDPIEKESVKKSWYKNFIDYLSEILKLFSLLKDLFFKLTFISILIRIITKYTWIKKIFQIIRRIFLIVFGTTFLDEIGAGEYFKHFWASIIEIFKDIFSFLKDIYNKYFELIWGKEEEKDTPEPKEDFFRENTPLEIKSEEKNSSVNWNWVNIIRILSIVIIISIFYDELEGTIWLSSILPLTLDKITFIHEIEDVKYNDFKLNQFDLYFFDENEISVFLNTLDENSNYVLSLEFIPDVANYQIDGIQIFLCKPIAVNKISNPKLISLFIFAKFMQLDEHFFKNYNQVCIKIRYSECY